MASAAGLGAFGFWIFIAAVVVAGIWYDARRKESQQETLRRVVESGQQLDREVIDRLLNADENKDLAGDLKVASLITLSAAPGLVVFGWFLSKLSGEILTVLTGVAFLVAFVGAGLWVAAKFVEKRYTDDQG